MLKILVFILTLVAPLSGGVCLAQDARTPARPIAGAYIVDEAAMLSTADAQVIREVAGALDRDQRTPIMVVTIRSLADYVPGGAGALSIERYAGILFNTWGIGYPDHNFGILLLVSRGDRKARIELGAGWKRDYDDATARIMSNVLIPRFRQGDFSGGIRDAVKALDEMARAGSPAAAVSTVMGAANAGSGGTGITTGAAAMNSGGHGGGLSATPSSFASGNWGLFAIVGLFILITIIKSIARGAGGGGYSTGFSPMAGGGSGLGSMSTGFLLGSLLGGRSSWGSSRGSGYGGGGSSFGGGGGFGGGGFGGGFSGGGGASGSW